MCLMRYGSMMKRYAFLAVFALMACLWNKAEAAQLIMVEQRLCEWCEAWHKDVGSIYHKTPEGKMAPLRRVSIHDDLPPDLQFITGLVYTPTFILIDGGKEIGRIRGYPGEDFFWGLLQQLIGKLN